MLFCWSLLMPFVASYDPQLSHSKANSLCEMRPTLCGTTLVLTGFNNRPIIASSQTCFISRLLYPRVGHSYMLWLIKLRQSWLTRDFSVGLSPRGYSLYWFARNGQKSLRNQAMGHASIRQAQLTMRTTRERIWQYIKKHKHSHFRHPSLFWGTFSQLFTKTKKEKQK